MAKYRLYVDRKQTIWNREWFRVEADSLNEAIERCLNQDVDYSDSEELYDTVEDMTPKENGNYPTVEVYQTDDDKRVYSNNPISNEDR